MSLNGNYYVAVYGYSYTTFTLLVTVNRKNQAPNVKKSTTLIYEGFPFTKRLHNELQAFYGHFEVDLQEGQAVILDMIDTEGKTAMFVKYGELP